MPITKSAKKALRQSIRRAKQNRVRKDAFRSAVKLVKQAGASGKENLNELISAAYKAIDKAAKTNVISKRTAARKKSRLIASLRRGAVK